jgi:coproporphyrinogen III oxidase-like Fe-S oxidoreductase
LFGRITLLGGQLRIAVAAGLRRAGFIKRSHSVFLLQNVRRAIAANGVEPLPHMVLDLITGLPAETDERILDDIASAVRIA